MCVREGDRRFICRASNPDSPRFTYSRVRLTGNNVARSYMYVYVYACVHFQLYTFFLFFSAAPRFYAGTALFSIAQSRRYTPGVDWPLLPRASCPRNSKNHRYFSLSLSLGARFSSSYTNAARSFPACVTFYAGSGRRSLVYRRVLRGSFVKTHAHRTKGSRYIKSRIVSLLPCLFSPRSCFYYFSFFRASVFDVRTAAFQFGNSIMKYGGIFIYRAG